MDETRNQSFKTWMAKDFQGEHTVNTRTKSCWGICFCWGSTHGKSGHGLFSLFFGAVHHFYFTELCVFLSLKVPSPPRTKGIRCSAAKEFFFKRQRVFVLGGVGIGGAPVKDCRKPPFQGLPRPTNRLWLCFFPPA